MFKMIFLLAGLAVGFGAGVYWGVHHPTQAQDLAAQEEQKILEAKKEIAERFKQKLDAIINSSRQGAPPAGSSGFVGGSGRTAAGANPQLVDLQKDAEREIQDLNRQISSTAARKK